MEYDFADAIEFVLFLFHRSIILPKHTTSASITNSTSPRKERGGEKKDRKIENKLTESTNPMQSFPTDFFVYRRFRLRQYSGKAVAVLVSDLYH